MNGAARQLLFGAIAAIDAAVAAKVCASKCLAAVKAH
jgi:hypothetical protein